MPVLTTYPGVYIEQIPSGVPTITAVATSIAAFVGYTEQGPVDEAVHIFNPSDFERNFGKMTVDSPLSYAVNQFFQNGGTEAYVVRVASGATSAQLLFAPGDSSMTGQGIQVTAHSDGTWGNLVRLDVDYDTINPDSLFNLKVTEFAMQNGSLVPQSSETYRNLSMSNMSPNYFLPAINGASQLVQVSWNPLAGNFNQGFSQGGALASTVTSLAADQNRIAVSIDGGTPIEMDLFQGALSDTNLANLLGKLKTAMQSAIDAAFGPGKATVAVAGTNTSLTVTSATNPATQASAVRITNASRSDACKILRLGLANGGFEKEGAAGYRPVQTGTSSGNLSLPIAAPTFAALTATPSSTGGTLNNGTFHAVLTTQDANKNELQATNDLSFALSGAPGNTGSVTFNWPNTVTGFRLYLGSQPGVYDLGYIAITAASVLIKDFTNFKTDAKPPASESIALNVFAPGSTTPSNSNPIVLPLWQGTAPAAMDGIVKAITTALGKVTGDAKQYVAGASVEYQQLLVAGSPTPENFLRIVPGMDNVYFQVVNFGNTTTGDSLLLTKANVSSTSYGHYLLGSGYDSQKTVVAISQPGTFPGNNGSIPTAVSDYGDALDKSGFYSLDKVDLFNIMCLPDLADNANLKALYPDVIEYCTKRRAMLIVDLPATITTIAGAQSWLNSDGATLEFNNVAAYFPRMLAADPLQNGTIHQFPNSGAMAGIWASTDAQRGVWKAPAGIQALINGATGLAYRMNDQENGELNPLGLNCLRTFPVIGTVVWGARTMRGADELADDYKYIPVRRLALFLEESLYRGTQWVVFEPNDEPLWAAIRLSVGAFMHSLFRQGAFQGQTPRDAYFVKCSSETTTPYDQDQGRVNIVVGFAPLKPAEFVVIQIQQIVNAGPT